MKNISKQYIAGLIDGEGYLGLLPSKSKELVNPSFEPVVKIGMTGEISKEVFIKIKEKYGGIIEKRSKTTKGGRIAYTYNLKSKVKVFNLLNDIDKHLFIKYEQSVLLKEFCRLKYCHPKSPKFDKSIVNRKVELYYELKQLKQPEPLATTN